MIFQKRVDNFMLILEIRGIMNLLYEIKGDDKYLMNIDKNNKEYCYISNKGCTICGYQERMMLECDSCGQ